MQALMAALSQAPPEMLPALMAQAGITPEQFAQLQSMSAAMGQGAGVPGGPMGAPPPGSHVVQLTQAEAADIQSIMSIANCSKQQALEAYLACDKNIEQAINLIFNSM
jgi:UV excision repair protein RAD23